MFENVSGQVEQRPKNTPLMNYKIVVGSFSVHLIKTPPFR